MMGLSLLFSPSFFFFFENPSRTQSNTQTEKR